MADHEKAIFAAGCFWGIEFSFQKHEGVLSTTTGYTGGVTSNPGYPDVCSGRTGHAEAVEVTFDPSITSFEKLAKHFFEIHNPALIGNHDNHRSQYRSAIFYLNDEQKSVAEKLIEKLKGKNVDVETEITKAAVFYKAEEHHQDYYNKNGKEDNGHRYKKKFETEEFE